MQETIITPHKSWKELFSELWEYREIFLFLGWRDILVHYKQTVIGVAWVILRPLLTVAIFTVIFSRIAGITSSVAPYPLIIFSGMLIWQFFVEMLTYGSNSYLVSGALVTKVYVPRMFLPASRLFCVLINFFIAFTFFLSLAIIRYRVFPLITTLLIPFVVMWLSFFSFSMALLFGALTVKYRDFAHIVSFLTQLGLYCTPIGFSLSMVPKKILFILALNPLTGIINMFRWMLLGEPIKMPVILISFLITIFLSCLSFVYFKHAQENFADVL